MCLSVLVRMCVYDCTDYLCVRTDACHSFQINESFGADMYVCLCILIHMSLCIDMLV